LGKVFGIWGGGGGEEVLGCCRKFHSEFLIFVAHQIVLL